MVDQEIALLEDLKTSSGTNGLGGGLRLNRRGNLVEFEVGDSSFLVQEVFAILFSGDAIEDELEYGPHLVEVDRHLREETLRGVGLYGENAVNGSVLLLLTSDVADDDGGDVREEGLKGPALDLEGVVFEFGSEDTRALDIDTFAPITSDFGIVFVERLDGEVLNFTVGEGFASVDFSAKHNLVFLANRHGDVTIGYGGEGGGIRREGGGVVEGVELILDEHLLREILLTSNGLL